MSEDSRYNNRDVVRQGFWEKITLSEKLFCGNRLPFCGKMLPFCGNMLLFKNIIKRIISRDREEKLFNHTITVPTLAILLLLKIIDFV